MTRLNQAQAAIAASDVDGLIISDLANVRWLTGFTGTFATILLTEGGAKFLTDSRYAEQAKEQVSDMEVFTFGSPTEFPDFLAAQTAGIAAKTLGFESNSVTYSVFEKWRDKLKGFELVPTPSLLNAIRMVKGEDEIQKIRRACQLADAAFEHVRPLIRAGQTEYDLALEIEFFFRRQGAEIAFPAIVVSGKRSARPHGMPSEKKLEKGDSLTMDFGAKLDGFCSDITRTVVVGEADERTRSVYAAVLEAQLAALDAIRPGGLAKDVDALSRTVLKKYDLAQYFGHGLGHGLGREVHDLGRMAATSEDVFAPGQVWTVEPGVYIPDFGGVRIEDDVVVTETGIEILTKTPKDLLVLPA